MIRNRIAAFACALLWGSLLVGTAASEWQACSDPRFQFVLQYPPGLVHSRDPGTSACSFKTPDAEFSVEAVLQPDAANSGDTLEARYQKELDLLGGTVTYKRKAETWFVLSGVTPDGTEFYRKQYTKGSKWIALRMTYPHARNERYSPWVTRIEKTFVPFATRDRVQGDEPESSRD